MTYNREWPLVLEQAREAIRLKNDIGSWGKLSRHLNIPRKTLQEAFYREFHIETFDQIINTPIPPPKEIIQIDSIPNENIIYSEDEDQISVESKSSRIKTLQQLIEVCKVDLEKWIVERFVVNKWEVGAKDDDGNIVIEPLFQVKAWLRPKIIAARLVQPVTINIQRPTKRKPPVPKQEFKTSRIGSTLVLTDPHFGFLRDIQTNKMTPTHDRRALSIAIQIATRFTFDQVIYMGDTLDLSDWTDKFIRSPEFYWGTQAAIIESAWFLNKMKFALPEAKHSLIEGNHDVRMEKAVINHLNSAYQLRPANEIEKSPSLSVPKLLALDEIGIEYVGNYPNGEVWINERIRCIHGDIVRGNTGDTAKVIVTKGNYTTIFGHIHRTELATRTIREKTKLRIIYAFCPGCLCHIDGRVPGANKDRQWQQGLGVIQYNDDNIAITPIPIENGTAIYAGIKFEYTDYLDELIESSNWKFDPE